MKALENREFLAFCKLLFFRSLKKQKIQAIYFEIYGLYFKISALYFSQQAMCFFLRGGFPEKYIPKNTVYNLKNNSRMPLHFAGAGMRYLGQ